MKNRIQEEWRPRVPDGMIEQVVEDELALLNPEKGQVYVLNALGAAIYDQCDGKTSVGEIVLSLENCLKPTEFDLEHETLRFLADMLEKEILM